MMTTIYQVDAFTDTPFRGNPAGVCLLEGPAEDDWMQQVAMEMNLSETAFLYPTEDAYHLRWFTPLTEIEMCGHATLASAHILFERRILLPDQDARFDTLSGRLTARIENNAIMMDFPATPPLPAPPPDGLLAALGIADPAYCGKTRFDVLVEVDSEAEVVALSPHFSDLKKVETRGVIVTSRADGAGYDVVSRFFAPTVGIDEDPVTGSAHCCLSPFWSEKLGRTDVLAYQASARGGMVTTRLAGERVLLGGQAVTVMTIHAAF